MHQGLSKGLSALHHQRHRLSRPALGTPRPARTGGEDTGGEDTGAEDTGGEDTGAATRPTVPGHSGALTPRQPAV